MRKIFAFALAALLLLAGCGFPGGIAAPSTVEPAVTTTAPATTPPPRRYNGIAEGDVIVGELTFYCDCAKCNGVKYAGVTADGIVLADVAPGDYSVAGANWLPFNALVDVDGTVYRIADRGGPGLNQVGRLDIYTPEGHEAALTLGRVYGAEVRIVTLPGG